MNSLKNYVIGSYEDVKEFTDLADVFVNLDRTDFLESGYVVD